MTIPDLCEVPFTWPHPEPQTVILTGTFDKWSGSIPLTKTPTGFEGTVAIPWGQKVKYKFIVDGIWIVHEDQPTETDPGGFVNNVLIAPTKPAEPSEPAVEEHADVKSEELAANGHAANGDSVSGEEVAPAAANNAEARAEADAAANEGKETPAIPSTLPKQPSTGYPQILADLANTIVARDGTSSTLGYMASGLGAAMQSVVGVDPINIQKISIPTPQPNDEFTVPGGEESVPNTANVPSDSALSETTEVKSEDSPSSPIAPIVPLLIVPVNAAENNTIAPVSSEVDAAIPAPVTESSVAADVVPETVVDAAPVEENINVVEEESATPIASVESAPQETAHEPSVVPEDAASVEPEVVDQPAVEEPIAGTPLPEAQAVLAADPTPEAEVAPEPSSEAVLIADSAPVVEVPAAEEPAAEPTEVTKAAPEVVAAPAEVQEEVVSPPSGAVVVDEAAQETIEVVTKDAPESITEVTTEEVKLEETVVPETAIVEEATPDATTTEVPTPAVEEAVVEVKAEEPSAPEPESAVVVEESATAEPKSDDVVVPEAPAASSVEAEVKEEVIVPAVTEEAPAPAVTEEPTAEVPAGEPVATSVPVVSESAEVTTVPASAETEVKVSKAVEAEAPLPVTAAPVKAEVKSNGTAVNAPVQAKAAASEKAQQKFPSTSSGPQSASTDGHVRKKRTSIFGKIRDIFHHDKHDNGKEKEKKKN